MKTSASNTVNFKEEEASDEEIFSHYLGREVELGRAYLSPIREERRPSFSLYKTGDRIFYKDFTDGTTGGAVDMVMKMYNLSYSQAMFKIKDDLKMGTLDRKPFIPKLKDAHRSPYRFSIRKRAFRQPDIDFWSTYGISKKTLSKYDVIACRRLLIYEGKLVKGSYYDRLLEPMYAYQFDDKFKIYRPGSKVKWLSNTCRLDIQGLKQLPKSGDLLIITKSLKDVMLLSELGFNAIAPQSESTFIPETILEDLKKRFKEILILFDDDAAGIRMSTQFASQYGLRCVFTSDPMSKDISDYYKNNGKDKTIELVKSFNEPRS